MRLASSWLGCLLVLSIPATVAAIPIGLGAFSGGETLINFTPGFAPSTSPVLYQTVTFSEPGFTLQANETTWASLFSNIPGASGGIAARDNAQVSPGIIMDFSTPVNRVGLLLSTGPALSWTVTAYDNSLIALESVVATMPGSGQAVFAGIERIENIKRIIVVENGSGDINLTAFDDLRFEVIPEPASLWVLALSGFALLRRR